MLKKICVYTCITGNYDNLKEISKDVYENNIDYYCFTNNKDITSNTWKVIYIEDDQLSNRLLARKIKILGNELINKKYDISVWMDGSISLKCKISQFLNNECDLENNDLVGFKHSVRNCIYEEAKACIHMMKDDPVVIKKQVKFLEKERFPKNYGLSETGFFVRKNKSDIVTKTMNLWYSMLLKYSKRDQLSFMYSVYKTKIKFQIIDLNIYDNKYFECINHTSLKKMDKYLVFFGENSQEDNLDLYYQNSFRREKNTYEAKFKILNNTNYIKFSFVDTAGIFLNEINIDYIGLDNYIIHGVNRINDKSYLVSGISCIELFGNFKIDEEISIIIEMNEIKEKDYIQLLSDYHNLVNENAIITEKLKKDNDKLSLDIKRQTKENDELKRENSDLKKEYDRCIDMYNSIVNSRGWKILEKFRKIRKVGVSK